MRENERGELLQLRIFIATAPPVKFFIMVFTVETADDAQLHEIVSQDGISIEEFWVCISDMLYFACIHFV